MKPRKIVLISIDTLRADRLGCYGCPRPGSPAMDALAGEGVLFPYAFSPSSYTIPVHLSILTGLYPANHSLGFAQNKGRPDPDSTIFLQEVLREEGYLTGAFVSAFILDRMWGLDWGFDHYDDRMTSSEANRPGMHIRDGSDTTRAALEWIGARRDEALFAWLHYFDVHGPYAPVAGFEQPFKAEDYGASPVLLGKVKDGQQGGLPEYQLLDVVRDAEGGILDYQRDLRRYLAAYDNGVRYQDHVVGGLFDGLREMGVYDDCLIILTADHGEALGENGVYLFHGLTATPEQTRVPLILKPPAGHTGLKTFPGPVSTVDIMPTVLDFVGRGYDGFGLDGETLLNPRPGRFVLSENEWQRSLAWDGYLLLKEKDVPDDGFFYYFGSKELCRGEKLLDIKTGAELPADPEGPAGELVRYARWLGKTVDPKERRIRDKDRVIAEKEAVLSGMTQEKEAAVAAKDAVIAGKETELAAKEAALAQRDRLLLEKEQGIQLRDALAESARKELESVYSSKSWRLTYPLRWFLAMLKGAKAR